MRIRKKLAFSIASVTLFFMAATPSAQAGEVFFPVAARRAALQQPAYAAVKATCLAEAVTLPEGAPRPFDALQPTAGYGSDHRAQEFSWQVMVLTGRALAGDTASEAALRNMLGDWAKADALLATTPAQDSYYALKRALLPLILGFAVSRDGIDAAEAGSVRAWIDRLVRKVDHAFGGDVDHNNHRYLTDSVLMAWGALNDDAALYAKGREGYLRALEQATAEGVLPLEARRGSRAGWYMRHALASLTVMVAIAEARGDGLFAESSNGMTLPLLMQSFLNRDYAPVQQLPEVAQNYRPGPQRDYRIADRGHWQKRGHGRHYMAFAEWWLAQQGESFAAKRIALRMGGQEGLNAERPLIDEYSGGNASCFWMQGDTP